MDEETRVRVKFVTKDESIRVTEVPLAVPTQLGRKGLSEVVSHLLGLVEAQSFDFSVDNQLLRCPLEKFFRIAGINTETTVTVEYFRSRSPPNPSHQSSKAESWVSCLGWVSPDCLMAGSYDGSVRRYRPSDCKEALPPTPSHDGPIKAIAVGDGFVVTGGKDRTIWAWAPPSAPSSDLHCTALLTGHEASVECLSARHDDGTLLSGDWSGMLCVWKGIKAAAADGSTPTPASSSADAPSKKKRKGQQDASATAAALPAPVEKKFEGEIKAHAQCVSGVQWDHTDASKAYTASWDHSVKAWDLEKRDCIHTLNGSKVVTCLSLSPSPHRLLATGHPDHRLRIWDLRLPSAGTDEAAASSSSMRRALASCDAWISDVAWHPTSAHMLASVSHDGCLRMWDLRSSKALSTTPAHEDHKALSLVFSPDGGHVFTSGSDGIVRSYSTTAPAALSD